MASFNKVILMGRLTRDPELKQAASGVKVADLGLAVSEQWKDKNGEAQETTCFVDVVVWDKQAEICCQYLAKGRLILVEGRLQLDEWTNTQGEKRSKLRVRANRVQFMPDGSRRNESGGSEQPGASHTTTAADQISPKPESPDLDDLGDDDDLPF